MKKILSTLLVAAMLLSLVIVAVMPTAAAEGGDWNVWGEAIQYGDNISDEAKTDVAGYGYNIGKFNGFTSERADWKNQSPFTHIQSAKAYDLKQGIYFEVVVEEFDYEAGDKWFNVNIWSQEKVAPPSPDPAYGFGLQTLIRPSKETGTCKSIQWMKEQWTAAGTSTIETPLVETKDEVNYDKFVVVITYDPQVGYHITINGSALKVNEGDTVNKADAYLNEAFGHDDPTVSSMAYIGFALHHTTSGGAQSATVTKFGTSEAEASAPTGNFSKAPENYSKDMVIADRMDPNEVPEGQPAILMTGNMKDSDLWQIPNTATGSLITIKDDFNVSVVGKGGTNDAGAWKVKMSKNYSIADFPTYMVITKNLCTCGGDDKTECEAWEEAKIYYMVGDIIGAESAHTADVWVCDSAFVIDGDVYHYFTVNLVEEYGDDVIGKDADGNDITLADGGRINGVRLDILDLDPSNPDSLYFEVCSMGFFASDEDAENYALDYFASLGGGIEDTDTEAPEGGSDTEPVGGTETEPETDTQAPGTEPVGTEPVTEEKTEAKTEAKTEEKTEAKTEAKTEEKTEAKTEEKTDDKKGGCGSVVGFGAVAVVVAVAAGFVSFKKKED